MTSTLTNLKKQAFKGVFTLTFRRLVLKLIDTAGIIFLARLLSQNAFGTFGIISFVVFTFLSFFSDIGFGAALIQKKDITRDDIQTTFTIQQILVTIILIASWFLAPYISRFYHLNNEGAWLIRVLSLSLFLTSFKTIPSILLERRLIFEKLIIPEILETIVYNSLAVYLAFHGYGVWSLIIAVLVRTLIGAFTLNLLQPWPFGFTLNRQSAHDLLHFGVPYQLNKLLALIKDNITPTIIAYWYGPAAVAYVNLAQNIASRPMEIINIVSRVSFPAYSRVQHNKVRLKRWLEKSIRLMSMIYYPAITGLLILAPDILRYLYANKSDKWAPALPALFLFLIGAYPVIISMTYTNALYALGYPKTVLYLMFLYTILTWLLGLPLIYKLGFVGIALAGLIITYTTLPLVIREINKVVSVHTFAPLKNALLASLGMGLIVFIFKLYFIHNLLTLFITVFLGAVIYLIFMYNLDKQYLKTEFINWLTLLRRTKA